MWESSAIPSVFLLSHVGCANPETPKVKTNPTGLKKRLIKLCVNLCFGPQKRERPENSAPEPIPGPPLEPLA
eukprot:744312-Amphidinium_carterae.1